MKKENKVEIVFAENMDQVMEEVAKTKYEEFLRERYDLMITKCSEYRGTIIAGIIQMESLMDTIIVNYFCSDKEKSEELMILLIGTRNTHFSTKLNIISYIFKKHYPLSQKAHPVLIKRIEEIITIRNILAHSRLETTGDSIKKFDGETIILNHIRKDNTFGEKKLDDKIVNEYIQKLNYCSETLLKVFSKFHSYK